MFIINKQSTNCIVKGWKDNKHYIFTPLFFLYTSQI